ncbi:serine/threonine-protein kinase-like protein DCLK1 [Lophium mytilinum]|uniref:Serine/threonine-protein kinase-like protein DCLK1 n=1 Tax=Lophium mytilinum TaxID=390894 RepID=A0A6A6QDP4_9PEZI|nr:serine/threonine-protein kinase-like protein DCLK1 [Lophium mytilinum]
MAPYSSSHNFQKLKLDTKPSQKSVSSAFASIPRRESQRDEDVSLALTTPELAEANSHFYHGKTWHTVGDGVGDGRRPYGSAAGSSPEDIEAAFRNRKPSITFDSQVTLDSGNRLAMHSPLPKPGMPTTLEEFPEREEYFNDFASLDRGRTLTQEPHYPISRDDLNGFGAHQGFTEHDHVASLTSDTTASPLLEEVHTPLDSSMELLLSPLPTTSPIDLPFSLSKRNGSQRSIRSYRSEMSEGSARRPNRRTSTRTGRSLPSQSPASAFLSRMHSKDAPLQATEPDDEGQEIAGGSGHIIGKTIGFGGFSVVKEVATMEYGKKVVYAVKIVRKLLKDTAEAENEQLQTQFEHEVEIWRYLKHPYILPLLRVYSTEFATFCITTKISGGTLLDIVRETNKQNHNGLDARHTRRYVYQLASAIRYLHNDVTIVHRDIKLENCLVDMSGPNACSDGGDILLCDFGMADFVVSDQRDSVEPHTQNHNQNIGPSETSTTVAGSLQYAAPELFGAQTPVFSTAADMWAFGVVIYTLVTARLPFNEGMDAKTTEKIMHNQWDLERLRSGRAIAHNPQAVIALVKGCLEPDASKRWTITEVLRSPWLEGCERRLENVERSWMRK